MEVLAVAMAVAVAATVVARVAATVAEVRETSSVIVRSKRGERVSMSVERHGRAA